MSQNGKRSKKKDVLTLGVREEVIPYDFVYLGWDAHEITDFIYSVAFTEMVSRPVLDLWDWSVRVRHLLIENNLNTVGKIMHISLGEINALRGCGFKLRKEIYDVMKMLNIPAENWHPNKYWEKWYGQSAKKRESDRLLEGE